MDKLYNKIKTEISDNILNSFVPPMNAIDNQICGQVNKQVKDQVNKYIFDPVFQNIRVHVRGRVRWMFI